jgi:hypothetical protein
MSSEIIESYIIPLIYFLIWLRIKEIKSNTPQIILFIISLFALYKLGLHDFEVNSYSETSKIGSGFLWTGSTILLGPCLFYLRSKNNAIKWGLLALLLLPILGLVLMAFLLLCTGQIWI